MSLPSGFARITSIAESRRSICGATHYVVECQTEDGVTETEVSRDLMHELGMFDALRDQKLVPLTRCCCQATQTAPPKEVSIAGGYAEGRSRPSVRNVLPPPGYIRVISVETLTDPKRTNDLVVVFYETTNGPSSIVVSAQHTATLHLQRAEREGLLIPLFDL
jgi:hypothetical protein